MKQRYAENMALLNALFTLRTVEKIGHDDLVRAFVSVKFMY